MGIVDCQQEKILCHNRNITQFPTLLHMRINESRSEDAYLFIARFSPAFKSSDKYIARELVSKLKD